MSTSTELIDGISIASPCEASWDRMRGNDCVRFCDQCGLNVYNLSAMNRKDAEDLVLRTEGRLCVRFYRRDDGTVLTRDCPVGIWQHMRRQSIVGFAMVSVSAIMVVVTDNPIGAAMKQMEPFKSLLRMFPTPPSPPLAAPVFLGMRAMPPTKTIQDALPNQPSSKPPSTT